MPTDTPQTYATHRRYVPAYHFVTSALLLLNLGYAVWGLIQRATLGRVFHVSLIVAVILMFYYLRTFPLAVQDRVIRLEERLRLAQLLPDEVKPRVNDFTLEQLIGLRFASDAEVPGLARQVLEGNISTGEEIKKLIKEWRADDARA